MVLPTLRRKFPEVPGLYEQLEEIIKAMANINKDNFQQYADMIGISLKDVTSVDSDGVSVGGYTLGSSEFQNLDGIDQSLKTTDSPTFDDLTITTPVNIYALSHDSFADFVANEHIDWTNASQNLQTSGDIQGGNFTINGSDHTISGTATFDNVIISGTLLHPCISGIAASGTSQGDVSLTAEINEIATNSNNNIVTLPSAVAGKKITIINNTGNTITVYPASGDDAEAGVDTSFNLTSAQRCQLWAYDDTNWAKIIA